MLEGLLLLALYLPAHLSTFVLLPFLNTGTMFAIFQSDGTQPFSSEAWNSTVVLVCGAQSLRRFPEMSSGHVPLFSLRLISLMKF